MTINFLTECPDDDWKMVCPYCGDDYIHHLGVIVFERDREDGPSRYLGSYLENPVWKPDKDGMNPSPRRDGMYIRFIGECGHDWLLQLYQHKGQTFVNSLLMYERQTQEEQSLEIIPYAEYLKTEHWQAIRKAAHERARHRCQLCNATGTLDTHHRTYERRGFEEPDDVIVLCRDCHSKFHDKLPNGVAHDS